MIRKLIRRMSPENPLWGAPRIQSELRLLGYEASKATVAKYMVRRRKPPSQMWRTFLDNHVRGIVASDFFKPLFKKRLQLAVLRAFDKTCTELIE